MAMPSGIPIVDLFLNIPSPEEKRVYDFMRPLFLDKESRQSFEFPVEYMFKDVPKVGKQEDYIGYTVQRDGQVRHREGDDRRLARERDRAARAEGRIPIASSARPASTRTTAWRACASSCAVHERFGIKAATAFPCGSSRRSPINDKKFYPLYAKCVELDIPIFVCVGVPGPAHARWSRRRSSYIDEVCWFFPELKFVMRHGAEPWTDLAVKLMLKWPNLYYSTSAFAPKHYPKAIIDYANTRGADKIIYAGYFPMGLTLERIFTEMPNVPFRDDVWPKFLRENAVKLLKL